MLTSIGENLSRNKIYARSVPHFLTLTINWLRGWPSRAQRDCQIYRQTRSLEYCPACTPAAPPVGRRVIAPYMAHTTLAEQARDVDGCVREIAPRPIVTGKR